MVNAAAELERGRVYSAIAAIDPRKCDMSYSKSELAGKRVAVCPVCGGEFPAKTDRTRYCSNRCSTIASRRR